MLDAVVTAFKIPDLRQRIVFTLGMLVIFRFLAAVPVPGVNREGLQEFIQQNALLGILNIFSGNSLQNFSIVALGVYPVHHGLDHHAVDDADHPQPQRAFE